MNLSRGHRLCHWSWAYHGASLGGAPVQHTVDCSIIVLGEAGAGKETLARHVHGRMHPSRPAEIQPFVVLEARKDPGTNPTEELFGAAERSVLRGGKLCAAHEGTTGDDVALRNARVARVAEVELELLVGSGVHRLPPRAARADRAATV